MGNYYCRLKMNSFDQWWVEKLPGGKGIHPITSPPRSATGFDSGVVVEQLGRTLTTTLRQIGRNARTACTLVVSCSTYYSTVRRKKWNVTPRRCDVPQAISTDEVYREALVRIYMNETTRGERVRGERFEREIEFA